MLKSPPLSFKKICKFCIIQNWICIYVYLYVLLAYTIIGLNIYSMIFPIHFRYKKMGFMYFLVHNLLFLIHYNYSAGKVHGKYQNLTFTCRLEYETFYMRLTKLYLATNTWLHMCEGQDMTIFCFVFIYSTSNIVYGILSQPI